MGDSPRTQRLRHLLEGSARTLSRSGESIARARRLIDDSRRLIEGCRARGAWTECPAFPPGELTVQPDLLDVTVRLEMLQSISGDLRNIGRALVLASRARVAQTARLHEEFTARRQAHVEAAASWRDAEAAQADR
jgi:hypothetical protein